MFENVKLVVEERTSQNGRPYMAVKAVFEDGSTMDLGFNDLAGRLCSKMVVEGKYKQNK